MATSGPDNRTARRSERTRTAILRAARGHFSSQGYDRASIRAIAADANIDPAMVMRYFGSKEGLFAAAVDLAPNPPDLSGYPASHRGEKLADYFVTRWETSLSDEALALLLRSAVTHDQASDRLREVYEQQLVAALRPVSDAASLHRRAGLIASHLLGIALCRYVLALPGVADRSPASLVADIAPTLQRYLTGPLPTEPWPVAQRAGSPPALSGVTPPG